MIGPTKHKMVISLDAEGLVPGMQGDGFASEPGSGGALYIMFENHVRS